MLQGEKEDKSIGRLKKDDGGWVESEVEKQGFITNYSLRPLIRVVLASGAMTKEHQRNTELQLISVLLLMIWRPFHFSNNRVLTLQKTPLARP